MKEENFSDFAIEVITNIAEIVENNDPNYELEVDLNGGILSIVSQDGTYIINKQNAAQEIWLSSPLSGPFHFSYVEKAWKSRHNDDLFSILSKELNIKIDEFKI